MRKAVLLLTVCRRYYELVKNIDRTRELTLKELGYVPDVVVVWARPEVSRLWLMQQLLADGKIQHLVNRTALPEEHDGGPTTYPESCNIRRGLEFVRQHYDTTSHYVVMQGADIWPHEGTFTMINNNMVDNEAVLFHWDNGCIHTDIWHTNFFAVSLDERYWPPLSPPYHADVLERQWGLNLVRQQLSFIHRWHNYNNRRFLHTHESEGLPLFQELPQTERSKLSLLISGCKPWYRRLLDFCGVWLR